jgi:hypothetical protein
MPIKPFYVANPGWMKVCDYFVLIILDEIAI